MMVAGIMEFGDGKVFGRGSTSLSRGSCRRGVGEGPSWST